MKRNLRMIKLLLVIFMWLMASECNAQKLTSVGSVWFDDDGDGYSSWYWDCNGDGKLEKLINGWVDANGNLVKETIGLDCKPSYIILMDDLNGDGVMDFVGSTYGYDENKIWRTPLYIYLSEGNEYKKVITGFDAGRKNSNILSSCIIDINHDGLKDIIFYCTKNYVTKPVAYIQTADHRFIFEELQIVTDSKELENANFSDGGDGSFTQGGSKGFSIANGMWAYAREFLFDFDDDASASRRVAQLGSEDYADLMVADINSDGYSDIITNSYQSLLSLPDGRYYAGTLAGKVAIADINGDGLKDIVLFNTSTNAVMLYLSKEEGGFTEKKLIDNGSITGMYCQDFNGDGLTDIMLQAASESYSFIVFFKNKGNGEFTKKENMLTGDYAFSKPYDFSNNGKASVLAVCCSNHYQNKRTGFDARLKFLTWDSNLTLSEEYITYNESQLYSTGDWNDYTQSWVISPFKVADFDGDGIMDILCYDNISPYSKSNHYIYSPFSPTANISPQQMDKPNVIYDKKSGRVKVEWQMGEDKETSSGDLRYTVRMGSTEESQNRMMYDAGVSRYCIANTSTWPQGEVFVSVRAIDANGKTGKWSPAAKFTVETQSAEFTMSNKNNDYIYFTTADTLVVHSLNGKQLTWTLPADGKIIKQEADSAYIMFTNYGEKIIEASMENGNRVSHTVTVLPVRHDAHLTGADGFCGIFDLNANGLTEILRNDGIYTFDKTYSKMGTMFNSDITSVEELTFIDKTMNGLPDVYGKEIVKNGVTNHWLINRGDLDFEVEATDIGNAPTLFVDINNDGLMDYMDGAVMINKGDFTFDKGNAGSRLFADLDRDGFIELVCFVNNTDASTMKTYPIILRIYKYDVISNQLKLVCEHKKTPDYDYGLNQTRCILDYNHDGYPDIVWSVRDNNYSYKGYALLGSKEMDYSEKVELPGSPMIVDLDNNGFTDYFTYSNVFRPYKGTVLMGEPEGIIKLDYPADCGFTNDFCITSIPVFCDYNNDGIPDSGKDYHYHGNINKSSFDNSSPTAPTYVSVSQEDNYVVVSWSGATDKETPNMSLRYNLSVKEKGKTGDGSYIISPLNLTKDEAKTVDAGTLQYRYATRFPIPFSRFAVGKTYEIQVQTIDGWHAHSPFSQVVEFTPTAQVLFTMPEKARVNQEVKFTLKSNSGVSPVIDADGGVVKVNGKTITWSTPGVKTVSITKGTKTSKRQIQIFDTPNLTFNVPSKVLTGSVLKVALPADFRRADATVELTGSNGLTCAINNDVAIVTVPKRSGNYELKISYEDDVFGKLEETRHVEGINFIPEISKVGITDDGCRIEWKNDMGSQISDMITGKVKIYRETSITGRYEEIGTANISDGFIIDRTARSDIKSYRYMITLPTTYGSESMPSNEHSTVLLLANQGLGNDINLHWNSYEGSQVATYTIYAGSSRDNLQAIDEVSGNTLSYVHHRNSNSLTYYAIGYTLTSELADAVPMHHAASAGSVCSNVICSDEAYNVLMVQNISVYEKDGYNELNKERTQLNMQATVTPALATLARVEWSITTGNDLAEVDQSGILTIKSNTTGGTVTVQARSIDGSNITGSMDISVTPYSITGMQTLMSESEVSLRYADHGIYVDNIRQATDVSILSISGSVVYRNRIATDYYIPLAGGIYIVKAGKTVQKVAIK